MKCAWFISFLLLMIFTGCNKDEPVVEEKIEPPSEVQLIFPFENSECTEGNDVTDTESTVLFEWRSADFTDEYELLLTNLNSGIENLFTTSEVRLPIVLQRATPYAWSVISKSSESDSTATSETWKFYNAGDGIENYAPFPADVISPTMSQRLTSVSSVLLFWNGSDVDNDIANYDVFFGTDNPPSLFSEALESEELTVEVSAGSIYYWFIVTEDEKGNQSQSIVYQFMVE